MRRAITLCAVCVALFAWFYWQPNSPSGKSTRWNQRESTFEWPGGSVRLPSGYKHRKEIGGDTDAGQFTSPDGSVVVRYDIGGYAGNFSHQKASDRLEERIANGARVWYSERAWPDPPHLSTTLVSVTFTDNGCANFFTDVLNLADARVIHLIAETFRPVDTRFHPNDKFCGRE